MTDANPRRVNGYDVLKINGKWRVHDGRTALAKPFETLEKALSFAKSLPRRE